MNERIQQRFTNEFNKKLSHTKIYQDFFKNVQVYFFRILY